MNFLELFVVALNPILETLIVTGFGLLFATEHVNLLGPSGRHHLNNLVFYVFTPALLLADLAETITVQSFIKMWFLPVNILITFIIGSLLAWVLVKITKTPTSLHGLVIGCCSAGNLGNLLLIIIPAICEESNSPFGDSSTCTTNGNAYASLSMAVASIYIWSYVYIIMRVYMKWEEKNDPAYSITGVGTTSKTLLMRSQTEPLLPSRNFSSPDDHLDQPEAADNNTSSLKKDAEILDLKMLFSPSQIGVIFGFIIGAITPIRNLLVGDSAPLRVIINSSYLMGEAAIPAMTLIIGANLLLGLKKSRLSILLIIGIIAIRNIIMPLMGIVIVKAAHQWGLVGSDSLYQFVLMLHYALPPATTVGTIAQLFESGESECSIIMLWTNVVATISLTLWSTLFIYLVQ